MVDGSLILLPTVHPGVIDVDVGGVVPVQDHSNHVVIVVNLCKYQFHMGIVFVKTVKFSFQSLEIVVATGNADMATDRSIQCRAEPILSPCILLL